MGGGGGGKNEIWIKTWEYTDACFLLCIGIGLYIAFNLSGQALEKCQLFSTFPHKSKEKFSQDRVYHFHLTYSEEITATPHYIKLDINHINVIWHCKCDDHIATPKLKGTVHSKMFILSLFD